MVKNIIINFPTNIGDTALGFPVLDKIKANYPNAKVTAIASPKTKDFLLKNSFIDEVVLFDKSWSFREKSRFAFFLRGKYDTMVDLKNSFLPVILGVRLRSPFLRFFPKNMHIKDKYLSLAKGFCKFKAKERSEIVLTKDEIKNWENLSIPPSLFVACASLSRIKCYSYSCLKVVVEKLSSVLPVVILGEKKDRYFYKDILTLKNVIDLTGKTRMIDVFYLLKNYARAILAVDSSILHIGSYLNIPAIGIFGPTHPDRSSPYSDKHIIMQDESLSCLPCEKALCDIDYACMKVDPQRVIKAVNDILNGE